MGPQKRPGFVLIFEDRWESLDTIFVTQSLFKKTVVDFGNLDLGFRDGDYANRIEKLEFVKNSQNGKMSMDTKEKNHTMQSESPYMEFPTSNDISTWDVWTSVSCFPAFTIVDELDQIQLRISRKTETFIK